MPHSHLKLYQHSSTIRFMKPIHRPKKNVNIGFGSIPTQYQIEREHYLKKKV